MDINILLTYGGLALLAYFVIQKFGLFQNKSTPKSQTSLQPVVPQQAVESRQDGISLPVSVLRSLLVEGKLQDKPVEDSAPRPPITANTQWAIPVSVAIGQPSQQTPLPPV